MIAVRKMTSIICWLMPLNVPRHQVRRVRLRHLATTLPSRSSSRPSPPKPLTTALHEIASASDPPIRVSQELARLAAGATQATDSSDRDADVDQRADADDRRPSAATWRRAGSSSRPA